MTRQLPETEQPRSGAPLRDRTPSLASAGPILSATAAVGGATLLAFVLQRLPHANLSLVFLAVVLIVSARHGFRLSVYTSILSLLIYNFLFTPPYYTFRVEAEGDIATLVFFLIMAALTGNLANRMRDEMAGNQTAVLRISTLYDCSRQLAAAVSIDEVLETLTSQLARRTQGPTAGFIANAENQLECRMLNGGDESQKDIIQAATAFCRGEPAASDSKWSFLNLAARERRIGLIPISASPISDDVWALLRSLCDQAAMAIERAILADHLEQQRLISEKERLRSALLSSVSHDLRTPLASIIGATTSLTTYGENFSPENRHELLVTVLGEAERLNRYIQNLLDMTRLDGGDLQLRREWMDLNDIISSAIQRLGSTLEDLLMKIEIEPEAGLIFAHGALIEQVIFNLLHNAARFSPKGGEIIVHSHRNAEHIVIEIRDMGPGIPASEQEKVFDMFFTGQPSNRGVRGTGLGLAICHGVIRAHQGNLEALAGPDGTGTLMRITLPQGLPPVDEDNAT